MKRSLKLKSNFKKIYPREKKRLNLEGKKISEGAMWVS